MANRIARPLLGRRHRVGHDAIDFDHRAMANCWSQVVTCEQLQFPFFVARLKKLMRTHFDHEAALMAQAGGQLCECHRREHRRLLDVCEEASALSQQNWRKAQSLLRRKLPKLVREHIDSMDQIAVLFINTNRARVRGLGSAEDDAG